MTKLFRICKITISFPAGLSGLLMAARIGSVNGGTGTSFEMDATGSCFIGGASAYGGSGTVPGIMVSSILPGVIFDMASNHKTGKS